MSRRPDAAVLADWDKSADADAAGDWLTFLNDSDASERLRVTVRRARVAAYQVELAADRALKSTESDRAREEFWVARWRAQLTLTELDFSFEYSCAVQCAKPHERGLIETARSDIRRARRRMAALDHFLWGNRRARLLEKR